MPTFEYSRWDGSQRFQPASTDAVFDQVADHFLEYGEYILRQLERDGLISRRDFGGAWGKGRVLSVAFRACRQRQ